VRDRSQVLTQRDPIVARQDDHPDASSLRFLSSSRPAGYRKECTVKAPATVVPIHCSVSAAFNLIASVSELTHTIV